MVVDLWWGELVVGLVGLLIGWVVMNTIVFVFNTTATVVKKAIDKIKKVQINTANDIKK